VGKNAPEDGQQFGGQTGQADIKMDHAYSPVGVTNAQEKKKIQDVAQDKSVMKL
jgi:hypothetical protein